MREMENVDPSEATISRTRNSKYRQQRKEKPEKRGRTLARKKNPISRACCHRLACESEVDVCVSVDHTHHCTDPSLRTEKVKTSRNNFTVLGKEESKNMIEIAATKCDDLFFLKEPERLFIVVNIIFLCSYFVRPFPYFVKNCLEMKI